MELKSRVIAPWNWQKSIFLLFDIQNQIQKYAPGQCMIYMCTCNMCGSLHLHIQHCTCTCRGTLHCTSFQALCMPVTIVTGTVFPFHFELSLLFYQIWRVQILDPLGILVHWDRLSLQYLWTSSHNYYNYWLPSTINTQRNVDKKLAHFQEEV